MESYIEKYLQTGNISPELEKSLSDPMWRRDFYRQIMQQPAPYRFILLRLLNEEIEYREALWHGKTKDSGEHYEGIYQCAFLLSCCGNPSDVIALWKVQYLNQDIGEIDVGNFVGAGVPETLSYLDQSTEENAVEIAEFIRHSLAHSKAEQWIESWKDGWRASIGDT